jgi:hypothetical protein
VCAEEQPVCEYVSQSMLADGARGTSEETERVAFRSTEIVRSPTYTALYSRLSRTIIGDVKPEWRSHGSLI